MAPTSDTDKTPPPPLLPLHYERALQVLFTRAPDAWKEVDFKPMWGPPAPFCCLKFPKDMRREVRDALEELLKTVGVWDYKFQPLDDGTPTVIVPVATFEKSLKPHLEAGAKNFPSPNMLAIPVEHKNDEDAIRQEILRDTISYYYPNQWFGADEPDIFHQCHLMISKKLFDRPGIPFDAKAWEQSGNAMLTRLCGQGGLEIETHNETVILGLPVARLPQIQQSLRHPPGKTVSHISHYMKAAREVDAGRAT